MSDYYSGATVSDMFMDRWRAANHTGVARPWQEVMVRRGRLLRSYHDDWPNPQFGKVVGQPIRHQWYPDWTPIDDWQVLTGVSSIELDQSFDQNGSMIATIEADNVGWDEITGEAGVYHKRNRGTYWPWRGWVPPKRPGSGLTKNQWYNYLPNAQIQVRQGYGESTAVKTFTGLIDSLVPTIRPDRITFNCRDFGGVLSDCNIYGWNKDKNSNDPITFISPAVLAEKGLHAVGLAHRWIIINDAVEIVECCLRWAGFKEWQVQRSGVNLTAEMKVDKSQTYMDVINSVATQLGYVFFIGEPTEGNDLSMGVPIFRPATVLQPRRSQPIAIPGNRLLTDMQPTHDNSSDRYVIRVRGVVNKKVGRTLYGDHFKRVNYTYWPPWIKDMAGVIKQLTYYNIGDTGTVLGFTTNAECAVAAILIAVQIALGRDTATAQTAGLPALGLDSFAYINDPGTGIASRLYITNRQSLMTLGGDGTTQQKSPYSDSGSSQSELLWATEFGGSLCDNPEWETIIADYTKATERPPRTVNSWQHGRFS
jgi:hypothetical protein